MKRLLSFSLCSVLLLTVFTKMAYSQSETLVSKQGYYQQIYDEKGGYSLGNSTSNSQISFAWNESSHLESLIIMYEATNDIKYLRMFIKAAGNVIDRRDDLRDHIGLQKIYDYRGISDAVWSTNYYNSSGGVGQTYAHIVHSGTITYPMVKFAYLVIKKFPVLQNEYSLNYGRYPGMKFLDIAKDMVLRVAETIAAHEDQWHETASSGWYEERCGSNVPISYNCMEVPMNYLSAFGKTILYMYKATGLAEYNTKITKLTNFIKAYTHHNISNDSYTWKYWEYCTNQGYQIDDLSHGALSLSFPVECFESGVLYTSKDMKRYANTFSKGIYKSPMNLFGYVGATSGGRNFHTNYSFSGGYYSYGWIPMAKYDPAIFHSLADIHIQMVGQKANNAPTHATLARLCANKQNFSPIAFDRINNSNKQWAGVGAGNFDGINGDEIIATQNSSAKLVLYSGIPATNGQIVSLGEYTHPEISNYWSSVATGNFYGDGKEEFIAINDNSDNTKNGFYFFEVNNNIITYNKKYTGWGPASDWAGAVGGQFTGRDYDDFIAVRNFKFEVYVFKMVSGNLSFLKTTRLNLPSGSKIVSVASGNLNSDGKDELILLVNSPINTSCGIYIYNVENSGAITLVARSTGWGPASDWNGLSVGDYDADGIDEFIVQRNFDGEFKIRKLIGSSIVSLGADYFPMQQSNSNLIGSGNFSTGSENDEIVVFRKCDGDVLMYEYKSLKTQLLGKSNQLLKAPSETFSKEVESDIILEKDALYPNPATDFINVNVVGDEENIVVIYDMKGNITLKQKVFSANNSMDISSLSSGIYFVNILSNNTNKTIKLVKR